MKPRLQEQSLTSFDKLSPESDETEKLHSWKYDSDPLDSYYSPKSELVYFDGNLAQYWYVILKIA